MKNERFLVVLISILMLITISCYPDRNADLIAKGNELKRKIENYQAKKGKLPNSLIDVGVEEKLEGPIYYEKIDDGKLTLWFGKSLGESIVYDSSTGEWK